VRDLEGAVTRLDAVARLLPEVTAAGDAHAGDGPRRVGLLAVERALGTAPASAARNGSAPVRHAGRPPRPVRIDAIIERVCLALRIERGDLLARGRHKRVVLGRALITHLARTLTTLSFPDIARALGRPSHSTVITAFQRLARQIEANEPVLCDEAAAPVSLNELIRRLSDDVLRDR
jgi:chromosomal replication initiator protein